MRTLLSLLLLAACAAPEPVCVPGTTLSCLCPTGTEGAQSCLAGGEGYSSCVCADYDAGTTDAGGVRDAAPMDAALPAEDGAVPPDASLSDGSVSDAAIATDASPPEPCRGGEVYDPPADRCYIRLATLGTTPCRPPEWVALRWSTTEDQLRIQLLLGALGGSGGTDLVRRIDSGWSWSDGSGTPRIEWASGEPNPLLVTTFLTGDGLVSHHRTLGNYICMRDRT